jgi:hypothetical protein
MSTLPSPNGANGGRSEKGRFAAGNKGGPGNPYARRVAVLRAALLEAVTPADMKAIVAKLVRKAKSGDIRAAREIIERTLGKPIEFDLLERLACLEALSKSEQL